MRGLTAAGLTATAWHATATLAAPALRVMLRRRAARGKEIAGRLSERRGVDRTPRPAGRLLWMHAASVGEAVSVLPVLAALAARPAAPWVLLTTGTVTSALLLARRLPEMGLDRVLHRFAPLDVPAWAARFLDHWRPDAAAFVESELWPNQLAALRRRGVPAMLLNARLSERSLRGWLRAPGFAREVVGAFDRVQARSDDDATRLRRLGARNVTAPGDLKFAGPELPADPAELDRLRGAVGSRPVWLAASTHPGEERVAADVHQALAPRYPGLLTVIAPRHPERGAVLSAELGVPHRAAGAPPPAGGVWLADTLGELGLLYRLCGVTFVGNSLAAEGGGQNPLEPARLGCAVAVGPRTGNFAEAVAALDAAGALARVADGSALAAWVGAVLGDPARRAAMGEAGRAVATAHADLPDRTAQTLLDLMDRR